MRFNWFPAPATCNILSVAFRSNIIGHLYLAWCVVDVNLSITWQRGNRIGELFSYTHKVTGSVLFCRETYENKRAGKERFLKLKTQINSVFVIIFSLLLNAFWVYFITKMILLNFSKKLFCISFFLQTKICLKKLIVLWDLLKIQRAVDDI